MFPAALRVLPIKDLKDLSGFFGRGYYRHAGPTDLKRFFHANDRGGNPLPCAYGRRGPRATVCKAVSLSP